MASEDRPQYLHGQGTIGPLNFSWGSGTPGKYWSIPYGDYPITPNAPTGAWAHQAGAIPIANNVIPDPQLGRNRIGIMIHSGSADSLDALYTQGCFKVDPQDWPAVRQEILKEASNGPLYLHVQPGGAASFTNTQTLQQTSIPTATTPNAPPVTASAPGTTLTSTPWRNPTGVNLPMGMGNNNPANIKYYEGSPFGGVVGPSKNTDQGDPQFVFESPQAGMNAAASLLQRKYAAGMTTPAQIIAGKKGWTPGNQQAAANIAKAAGIGVDDDIGMNDPVRAQKFLSALVQQEQGGASRYYPSSLYETAVKPAPAQGATLTSLPYGAPARPYTPTPGSPDTSLPYGAPARPYTPTPGQQVAATPNQAAPAQPQTVADKIRSLITPQQGQQGQQNQSPLGQLASSVGSAFKAPEPPKVQEQPPPSSAGEFGAQQARMQASAPLFQQIIAQAGKPLTFTSAPPGSQAGLQQSPGLTLNTNPYAVGYGYGSVYGA